MSRHHLTLPPIIYTPEPPKPKGARRRRVGTAQSAGATDAAAELDEAGADALVQGAALPQHSRPIEAVERRTASTTGKLSEDTLKALLAAQEESGHGGG